MASSLTKKQYFSFVVLILISGIVFGSVSLVYPFGRDQGIYAYAGKLLLEGKIDYKYVFDVKPPGVHFIFALAQMIFGTSMLSMRAFDILWQSITGFIIFLIVYRFTFSRQASYLSSLLYIFLYFRLDYWHTLQADGFLNLPMALSVLMLINIEEGYTTLKMFLSGLFFGIVILFKYTMIIFLPAALLVILFSMGTQTGERIKNLAVYVSGFVLINLLTAGIYFYAGALNEFINVQFVQTPFYAKIGYETESGSFIVNNIVRLFFGSVYSLLILFSVLSFILLLIKKQLTGGLILIYLWMLSSVIGLIIQWKFFYYHFLVIIPPISVGTSIFYVKFKDMFKKPRYHLITGLITSILIVFFIFAFKPYSENFSDLYGYASGKNSIENTYIKKGFTSDSAFMIGKTFNAVKFVKENTAENDGIYVWGFDPLIYYLSGRHCVSRFIYNFPLYWKGGNEKFRREFMKDIQENAPKLILISQRDPLYYISGYTGDSKSMLEKFPDFNDYIEIKYRFLTQIDDFYFYGLKELHQK